MTRELVGQREERIADSNWYFVHKLKENSAELCGFLKYFEF
jgi:hypothetical protein